MQRLEVSGAVRPIYGSLGVKRLNTELSPICHLLALVGAHHILHISRISVNDGGSLLGSGSVSLAGSHGPFEE